MLSRLLLGGPPNGHTSPNWQKLWHTGRKQTIKKLVGEGQEVRRRRWRTKAEMPASWWVWRRNRQSNYSDKNTQKTNSKGEICVWTYATRKTDWRPPSVSKTLFVDSKIILSLRGNFHKSTLNSSSAEIQTPGCFAFSVKYSAEHAHRVRGHVIKDGRPPQPVTYRLHPTSGLFAPVAQSHGASLSDLQCPLPFPRPHVWYPTSIEYNLLSTHKGYHNCLFLKKCSMWRNFEPYRKIYTS